MKRTTRTHLDVDALTPIAPDAATHGGTVRLHANPERRLRREATARDERHAVRRELHDAERDPDARGELT